MIQVGHDEGNIRTTMVLLIAQYAAGVIPAPLAVRMAPAHLLEEAWRAAAIAHLNGHTPAKEREVQKNRTAQEFGEYNERLDWEEKRERNSS